MQTIKELRISTGLTQKAFAAALGIPHRTLEDWEGGKHQCPAYVAALIAFRVEHDSDIPRRDSNMGVKAIQEIVSRVRQALDTLQRKKPLNDMEYGQLLAHAEILSILQSACAGYDLAEIGLDFDVEKTYFL